MSTVGCLLFDGFEALDLFGPVEVFGRRPEGYALEYLSLEGGMIPGAQGFGIETKRARPDSAPAILLLPGGRGTRREVGHEEFLALLRKLGGRAEWVLSVCTGSALLAAAGLLSGKRATSNKRAFDWVRRQDPGVRWEGRARWVVDGKFYTSSGVSAGIDMALAFLAAREGRQTALDAAREIEYLWHEEAGEDPFALP